MRNTPSRGELGLSHADILGQFRALDESLIGIDRQENGGTAAVLRQHERSLLLPSRLACYSMRSQGRGRGFDNTRFASKHCVPCRPQATTASASDLSPTST